MPRSRRGSTSSPDGTTGQLQKGTTAVDTPLLTGGSGRSRTSSPGSCSSSGPLRVSGETLSPMFAGTTRNGRTARWATVLPMRHFWVSGFGLLAAPRAPASKSASWRATDGFPSPRSGRRRSPLFRRLQSCPAWSLPSLPDFQRSAPRPDAPGPDSTRLYGLKCVLGLYPGSRASIESPFYATAFSRGSTFPTSVG